MSDNTGNTLIALITGAIVGVGLGILYAPQSGTKTRKQIKDEALKAKDKFSDEYEHLADQVSEFAENAKEKIEDEVDKLFEMANTKADNILANLEQELQDLRNKNEQLAKELENLKS